MMKFAIPMFVLVLFLNCSPVVNAEDTITIASNRNASPGWSEYSLQYGYILHIVREVFVLAGIQVEMKWYPWKRAFETAKNYYVDSTCCWFLVKERTQDFYYSDPVVVETQVFFHLKSFDFDWKSIDDLKGIPIGGDIGFHYDDALDEAEKNGKIMMDRVPRYEQNLRKLLAGHIKLYPLASITAYDHLRTLFPPETVDLVTYHPKPILQKTLHLLIPKKMNEERAMRLLSLFNQGLQQLKDSGKYDEILKDAEAGVYRKMDKKWRP